MDSVIRGNSITREAHYLLDSVLADPSLPRVTIRDPLGVAIVTDGVPTKTVTGVYQYTYAVVAGASLGVWQDEWQGTLSGQALGPTIGYFEVLPVGAIAPVPSVTYTYNLATDTGKVRMLIQDHDMSSVSSSLPLEQRSAAFTDEEIAAMLVMTGSDLYDTAALALRTWAASKQLIVIARRLGQASVDYGSIRSDLLAMAKGYEERSTTTPADGYAEIAWDDFTMRRILTNVELRDSV